VIVGFIAIYEVARWGALKYRMTSKSTATSHSPQNPPIVTAESQTLAASQAAPTGRGSKAQQALDLAYTVRDSLHASNPTVTANLRSCKTICKLLGIEGENEWIDKELDGYSRPQQSQVQLYEEVPSYRRVRVIYRDDYGQVVPVADSKLEFIERFALASPVGELESNTGGLKVMGGLIRIINETLHVPVRYAEISGNSVEAALNGVTNRCLEFVNEVIDKYDQGSSASQAR
jgi:hypothetical protein